MADGMGSDLMPVAVELVHVVDALANVLSRAAEIDAGVSAALVRAFVQSPIHIGDEIYAADEEGEMNAIAIPVHLGSEIRELLPAIELSAVVESHDDELRRTIHAGPGRRKNAVRNEQRQCQSNLPRGQSSPPTEIDS